MYNTFKCYFKSWFVLKQTRDLRLPHKNVVPYVFQKLVLILKDILASFLDRLTLHNSFWLFRGF